MPRRKAVVVNDLDLCLTIPPPWKHQEQTLRFLQSTSIAFDNSDPGVGKTRSQVEHYAQRPKPKGRWLVLCPKTLMVSAWGEDIQKFAPHLTVSFAHADNREEAFASGSDVVVLNVDGVKWLGEAKNKKNLKWLADFDHLTIDEYTVYKHPTSLRSKAAANIRKHFTYRYALSGTPNPNTVMELWHPTLILDNGKRLGDSYFKLRSKVQLPEQIGPSSTHLKWTDKPGVGPVIDEILSDITIRHVFEEVMTHVPPNHRHTKHFDLAKRAQSVYEKIERELIVTLETQVITAVHAAALRTKLLQIASGAVYNGGEDRAYSIIDTTRYELITDLIEERDHSVVFFNWKHQRDLLQAAFKARGITAALIDGSVSDKDRAGIVRDYQAGLYQTILLHPRTGAHGLTLTRGTTTVFSSPIYEADLMKQAIARIYRGSQNLVTNTIFIEAKNTVEQAVYARLFDKAAAMGDLLDLMSYRNKS